MWKIENTFFYLSKNYSQMSFEILVALIKLYANKGNYIFFYFDIYIIQI